MKKRILSLTAALTLALLLSSCACEHEWADATCDAPKTCTKCAETEGEALEHEWVDANFQSPKSCKICNAAEGEKLTAGFEEHGFVIDGTAVNSPFTTVIEGNEYTLTVESHEVVTSTDKLAALDGYEWHLINISTKCSAKKPLVYEVIMTDYTNYYDPVGFNQTMVMDPEAAIFATTHTVNFNGVDYTECRVEQVADWDMNQNTNTLHESFAFRVPVGFDGIVLSIGAGSIVGNDYNGNYMNYYADENTIFVRFS